MQQILLRYREAPGITMRIGLHSIRRACATHMLARGASPVAIQALLGHSALQHLSQYLKVTITELKKAHEESRVGE
jgi:site-specific recombinase XerD